MNHFLGAYGIAFFHAAAMVISVVVAVVLTKNWLDLLWCEISPFYKQMVSCHSVS